MARLPQPGGDSGNWGEILNDYLSQSHKADGSLKDDVVTGSVIAGGSITSTHLSSAMQSSLGKADTAYQKSPNGIPLNDVRQTDFDQRYQRGVSVANFTGTDTQMFQSAFSAAQGTVYIPARSGRYVITEPITIPQSGTARSVIGLGNGMVEIEYRGTGSLFQSVSTDPADTTKAPTDLYFENLRIDGYNNTSSTGAFLINGAYFVNFERVEVRRFAGVNAVGVDLQNVFNVDWSRSNVLSISNGIGLRVGGSSQQVTNVHIHDFVIQRSAVNIDIQTTIQGGGFQLDNGAIRANDSAIAVRMQGKFTAMEFGPALHIESETAAMTNTTTGFVLSGSNLYTSAIKFHGIDFYNIKTLFNLNASAGTVRNVEIDHIYATGLTGLVGTAFSLTNLFTHLRMGRYQISTNEYTTLYSLTNTEIAEPIWVPASILGATAGTPSQGVQLGWPVWLLDADIVETVGTIVKPPISWSAVAIDVLYTNAGAGTGNFRFRGEFAMNQGGESIAAPSVGTIVTSVASGANLVKTVTLNADYALASGKQLLVNVARVGTDSADTVANDAAILGIMIRRVR